VGGAVPSTNVFVFARKAVDSGGTGGLYVRKSLQERGGGCVLCLGVGGGLVMYVVRVSVVWYLWRAVWRCLALCGA
jgi:hypothetical protein